MRNRYGIGRVISELGRRAGIVVRHDVKTGKKMFASADDLRRSFAQPWSTRVEAATLQAMMRHAAIDTTLRHYVDKGAQNLAGHIHAAFARIRDAEGVCALRRD